MPISFEVGVRDCGHWTAPFQDSINFATLRAQATDCRSCATIMNWILDAHASCCDSETNDVVAMYAFRKARERSRWRTHLHKVALSCVRGLWFTCKFAQDLGLILIFCGLISVSVLTILILGVVLWAVLAVLGTACCCFLGRRFRLIIYEIPRLVCGEGVTLAYSLARRVLHSLFLRMFGANLGRQEGHRAPPMWTELVHHDDYYKPTRCVAGDDELCIGNGTDFNLTGLKIENIPLAHPWFEFPRGSSCIRISSDSTSTGDPGLGCNIYRHTYNPRGPVGSLVYCAPGIGQRENHPTCFLSLAAGKLFLTAWHKEDQRWSAMRSRVGCSLTKLEGQQYHRISTFDTAPNSSSGVRIEGQPLPTRILDLGPSAGFDTDLTVSAVRRRLLTSTVKVITTLPGASGRYLALSHRWGDDEEFKLTKSSLSSFQRDGVPFCEIPKTFQDALVTTRLLRHRYLWIDALCIVQDDVDDWARESARMAAVYSNASCTISAHTARDSRAGFLDASFEPPPTLVLRSSSYFFNTHRTITHLTLLGSFADQVASSFLSQRGWVFQERVLSRRLLHFVHHHTFFEDAAGPIADDVLSGSTLLHRPEDSKWSVTDSFRGSVYWYRLVEKYSRCSLTYEKDRLPAIAGLAESFSKMNNPGKYLLGLWERSVHMGLLWINASGRPFRPDGGNVAVKSTGNYDDSDRLTLSSDISHNTEEVSTTETEEEVVNHGDLGNTTVKNKSGNNENSGPAGDDAENSESTGTLPSWSWACSRGWVIYPSTLSDSMESDLLLVGNGVSTEPSDGASMATFHRNVSATRLLVIEGMVVDLPLVQAQARPTQQETPFLDSRVEGVYSMTSAGLQFGFWVSLDNQTTTSNIVVFPRLSCLRVCWLVEADNTFVMRYQTKYYFLLLEEVGGSWDLKRYRRIGVGVTCQNHWAGVERRRIQIE